MPSVNVPLYDILTRHQIYLEGVKTFAAADFSITMDRLDEELRRLLAKSKFSDLGELTKNQLAVFIAALREIQSEVYNEYVDRVMAFLLKFMAANVDVMQELLASATGLDLAEADDKRDHKSLFGLLAASGSNDGNSRLWSIISKAPLPATGMLLVPLIRGFANNSAASVENIVRRGYANNWKLDELLTAVVGTPSLNFRDGQLNRIRNGNAAISATLLQHVAANTGAAVQSVYGESYRWISVIDGRTSDICISRANKIFRFGGPLPPAHINCRSSIEVLVTDAPPTAPSDNFADWIRGQPANVQNDLLSVGKADQLRSGALKTAEPRFEVSSSLSIEQFKAKTNLMLTNG